MEIQKSILLFFSQFRNPFAVKLFEFFSMFGEEVVPLAIALFLFWCVDKKKGFISISILVVANSLMNFVKCIVRFPRPWKVMPEISAQRLSTATGYSFPSGHSTAASSFFSAVAACFRKRWISVICAVIILLVPVSRMFLCVHWPMDVGCGMLLGTGTTLVLFNFVSDLFEHIENNSKKLILIGIAILCAALAMGYAMQFKGADEQAYSDFSKGLALLAGVLIFYPIEAKFSDFSIEGKWSVRIIRYLVGLAGALFFMIIVKKILPYVPVISVFRYFAVASWSCLYPFVGRKLRLFR